MVIILPPINTSRTSPNDLINNASKNVSGLFNACLNDSNNYQSILGKYNLECSDIYNGSSITIDFNADSRSLYSLNRLSYDPENETPIYINNQELYVRKLSFGNTLQTASLKVVKINSDNRIFYIALSSGDLISGFKNMSAPYRVDSCTYGAQNNCLTESISVRNQSTGKNNANNSTAYPNNTLIYTMATTNNANFEINNYKMTINIANSLAYSKILNSYGGHLSNGDIIYLPQNIKAKQTTTEEFALLIKNPVSNLSVSASDRNFFNLKMITSFGNVVNVNISGPFNKNYEKFINNPLPSINYQISLVIMAALIIIDSYFLLRVVIIKKEIKNIKSDRHRKSGVQ
jgi:hypothetical protein